MLNVGSKRQREIDTDANPEFPKKDEFFFQSCVHRDDLSLKLAV